MDIEIVYPPKRRLVFDRRTFDVDGRLTITDCVISAAQVNPYQGREIPDAEALGLEPDRIYLMYRDAAALKAAVPLFDGVPLLIEHASTTANDPKQQLIVGTVRNCRWDDGKVMGTLSVWDADAIRGIESKLQKDLSAGYRYTPQMTPGVAPDGSMFDGSMGSPLVPNHVALVTQGRVTGAQVGDASPGSLSGARALERLIPGYGRLR